MKTRKSILFFLMLTILAYSLAFPRPTYACSCVRPGSPLQEFAEADAVFIGKVTGTGSNPLFPLQVYLAQHVPFIPYPNSGMQNISFFVVQSWKGVDQNTVTIYTSSGIIACGYTFTLSKDYVVYAYHTSRGYTTNICTRTSEVLYAATDMVYLSGLPKLQLKNTPPPYFPLILCGGTILGITLFSLAYIQHRRKKRTDQNRL